MAIGLRLFAWFQRLGLSACMKRRAGLRATQLKGPKNSDEIAQN